MNYKLSTKKENLFIKILLIVLFAFVFLIILRYILGVKTLKDSEAYLQSLRKIISQDEQLILEEPVLKTTDPRIGNLQAENIIVIFSDFQCSYSAQVIPTLNELLTKYQNEILIVWKDFSNPSHAQAKPAAVAARCAQVQGKFWEYHDYLYANQGKLDKNLYKQIAGQIGLNLALFNQCYDNQETLPLVENSFQEGIALKIDGTPYLFVNGQRFSGAVSLEDLEKVIQ